MQLILVLIFLSRLPPSRISVRRTGAAHRAVVGEMPLLSAPPTTPNTIAVPTPFARNPVCHPSPPQRPKPRSIFSKIVATPSAPTLCGSPILIFCSHIVIKCKTIVYNPLCPVQGCKLQPSSYFPAFLNDHASSPNFPEVPRRDIGEHTTSVAAPSCRLRVLRARGGSLLLR